VHALIIEDEFLIALALEDMLSELGYLSFDWAGTEDEAVEAVRRRRPDLITADIHLRVGNGISAVARIDNEEPGVPAVFVTANDNIVLQMDRDAIVLSKPVRLSELSRACAKARSAKGTDEMERTVGVPYRNNVRDVQAGSR
jgi:CheY-like chemotaxis protein